MSNALADFVIYLRVERRLSDATCVAYERCIRSCIESLRAQGIAALDHVRTPDLRRFIAGQAERRPSPSSQAQTIAALRSFFRFCVESEYIDRDPAHVLRTPKKREALPDVLDRAERDRLLAIPGKEGVWTRLHAGKIERDQLLLALFALSGLRRSELLGLDVHDVDLDRRLLRVRHAKGGRERVVPIHPALIPLFEAYLRLRRAGTDEALFLGVLGRRLTANILAQTFRRYAHAAGVTKHKRVTPHTLRHVFATELLGAGANLRQIQELLGHKHLDSTQRYTRVTAHQLRGAVKRLKWATHEPSSKTYDAQASCVKREADPASGSSQAQL
jgi:site-specific recombinase XerD